MKANILYLFLALVTGALIPIQAATNATFSKAIGAGGAMAQGVNGFLMILYASKIE